MAIGLPVLGALAGWAYLYGDATSSQLGLGALVALAALIGGGLFGFLFGIPRSAPSNDNGGRYSVNTNLEQISDWLTKILIGVGLVQFRQLADLAGDLVGTVGQALGGGQPAEVAAGALMVFFAITGFLVAYVMTRMLLPAIFEWSDGTRLESAVQRITDERSGRADLAIQLATDQLDENEPEVDVKELRQALAEATDGLRRQVFDLARKQRRSSWRDATTKWKTASTAPVFRALTGVDPGNHRYWAELGFALKDQVTPDRAGAVEALDRAIEVRGADPERRYALYEFARALARAGLSTETPPDQATEPAIRADLAVAYRSEPIRRRIAQAIDRLSKPGVRDSADTEISRIRSLLPSAT